MPHIKQLKDLEAENTRPRELLERHVFVKDVIDGALQAAVYRDAVQAAGSEHERKEVE